VSSDNWKVPSQSERALELVASDFYVAQAEDSQSPIDDFYSYLRSIITIGTREALELHPSLGKVLLLGIVSGTEYYFRAMLSKLIRACPLTRAHSAPQMLTFGATEYYSRSEIGFALLEGHSFSSKSELVKQTERVTAFRWKDSSSISSAVAEFDRLCHLRHAAVHARGDIGARNIQELKLDNISGRIAVKIDFDGFQQAAAVCQNVVRAYNAFLYTESLRRWIDRGLLSGQWNRDRTKFSAMFRLFHSSTDNDPACLPNAAYNTLLPDITSANAARAQRALQAR
jgi:hypothetical protein